MNPEAGSTALPILLGILAASLLALPLLGSLQSAWKAAGATLEECSAAASSGRADKALRLLALRISPPWWMALEPSCFQNGQAILPWLDGKEDLNARVEWKEGILILGRMGGPGALVGGLSDFSLRPLMAGGMVRGLEASWEAGGRTWLCLAPFGSQPLCGGHETP